MTTTFNCPTCGAPLAAPPDSATTIKCQHCGNTVVVPETLRSDTPETAAGQTAAGPRRWSLELLLEQPGQLRELARLVQAGQKIEAIKLYRQLTGAGLKEAKDSVEQLAAGQLVQVSQVIIQETVTGRPDMAEIRRLLLAGKKIEAIKLYRQATGLGLKESKDVIETFEGKLGDAGPEPAVVVTTPLDADVMVKLAEVRNILATGDKLAAIKRFRQHFQCGLAEAKEAVEAMAHGQPVPPWTLRPTPAAAPARRANRRPNTAGGWFAALGGILSLGLCILLAGSGPLMLSGAFRQAAGLAVNDPAVRAALGTPVNVVWWRLAWGQINCGSRCSSNFSFYVAGPKGEARVQVLSDSSGGFPFVGEGEWTPDLRYYLPDQTQALGVTATPRPRPATPTFSVAELDATAGALARATRQAESRATAAAQADRDATATALADETQAAQATATQMRRAAQSVLDAQAGWQTSVIVETYRNNANGWPAEPVDDGSLVVEPAVIDEVYRWSIRPASGGHYFNLLPGAVPPTTDFIASVDVRLTEGGTGGVYVYGLTFRAEGRDYGLFGLTNEGDLRLYGVYESAIYQFYDFSSPAVRTEPGAVNRLTVRALGPDFVFEVNGEVVFVWNQPDLNDGRIGLGVDIGREGSDAVIEFDNFEVVAP